MNVYLKTLGCRLNEAEAMMWAKQYQELGLKIVTNVKDAQICVVNSCAVTASAVAKSKKQLRKLKKLNKDTHLVLSGCFASLEEKSALAIEEVDQVISNQEKDNLVKNSLAKLGLLENKNPKILTNTQKNSRAFIKVQDGCRNRCTFCIVTVARGEEKSRSIKDVVADVVHFEKSGFNEIVITGVHLGGYGSDTGENLKNLIEAILEKTSIKRIRMGSLEPWDIPNGFFELWQNTRLMPHFHLPLQSGCDKTLKRMARRCMTNSYEDLVITARRLIPNVNITTDVIVGFPGEDLEEWDQSKLFIKKIGFGHIHTFPYSTRAGTKAAILANQQSAEVKKYRVQELLAIACQSKANFINSQIGFNTNVLFENKKIIYDGRSFITGLSENYLRIAAPILENKIKRSEIYKCVLTEQVMVDSEIFIISSPS